jgi:orotate phosphoribosyltransferase
VFEPGTPVVLIEDVITTGGSALKAAEALRGEGAVILGILAVVDREEGGRQRLEGEGYAVVVLTTTTDLLHEVEV